MFVNQPDDAQLVTLWHDPETCPAIARRLGVSLLSPLEEFGQRRRCQSPVRADRRTRFRGYFAKSSGP
jgi:hypothetical protein